MVWTARSPVRLREASRLAVPQLRPGDAVPAGTLPGDGTAAARLRAAPGSRPRVRRSPAEVFKVWDFVAVFVARPDRRRHRRDAIGYAISGRRGRPRRRAHARVRRSRASSCALRHRSSGGLPAHGHGARCAATSGSCVRLRDWWALAARHRQRRSGSALLVLPLRHLVDENQGVVDDLLDSSGAKLAVHRDRGAGRSPRSSRSCSSAACCCARCSPAWPELGDRGQALVFGAVALPRRRPRSGRSWSLPALFGLGAISGVLAVRSGELSQSILLHMGFNLLTVLAGAAQLADRAVALGHRLQSRAPNADI